jgi:hypothetical protein
MTGRRWRLLGWLVAGGVLGMFVVWWRAGQTTAAGPGQSAQRAREASLERGTAPPGLAAPGSNDRTRSTPRFVLDRASTAVQNDPRALDYDPRRLIRIGKRVDDVFAAEPRIAAWAGARERTLRSEIGKDLSHLVPLATIESVECRSSTCRVTIAAPEEQVEEASAALTLTGRGTMSAVRAYSGDQTRGTHELFVLFSPEHRPDSAYQAWYDEERRRTLAFLRKTPGAIPHLDHARIPEE